MQKPGIYVFLVRLFVFLMIVVCSPAILGQAENQDSLPAEQDSLSDQDKIEALKSIIESIAALQKEIRQEELVFQQAKSDEAKANITETLQGLTTRLEALKTDFTIIASGIDPEAFFEKATKELDWRKELQEIFLPILIELKAATAHPRDIEKLRSELYYYDKRIPEIQAALENLKLLKETSGEAGVDKELTELISFWEQQEKEFSSEKSAIQLQIQEKEKERKTFAETAQDIMRVFFRSRGRNLFFALLAFAAAFLVLRSLHRLMYRLSPFHQTKRRQFIIRLIDVLYYLFTLITAISALMVVLYLSSDWVLLGLAILFLAGLAWAGKYALPTFLEQAKLLLDLGPVREGERLIYKDVPWQVEALNIYTDLYNPALKGGTIRLPLKDLIGLRSRPFAEEEPWFPTREGDWIVLSDEFYGKVVIQTPETVVIETIRGSYKSYPTADFLHQHPRNLSINVFAVNAILGIDYKYRNIVNTEVITKVKAFMEEEFKKEFYGEHLVQVIVELKNLGESSLDIITIAKFSGEAASEYTEIGWKLQQNCPRCRQQIRMGYPIPAGNVASGWRMAD